MPRNLGYKLTSEQNVPKPVADIRHSVKQPKPKPGVQYSKAERKANAKEIEALDAALLKCKSDIGAVTKERQKVGQEIETEEKRNSSLVNGLIDESLASPQKDIIKLLSDANSSPKLNELRGSLVRLEAAFKQLLQKERQAKADIRKCKKQEDEYVLVDTAEALKATEKRLIDAHGGAQKEVENLVRDLASFKALSNNAMIGHDFHRFGIPAWVQNFYSSHQHKLLSNDYLELATLLQRINTEGNPFYRPNAPNRMHNLVGDRGYYNSGIVKE